MYHGRTGHSNSRNLPDIRVTAAVFCVAPRGVNSAHIVHLLTHAVATLDEQSIVKEVKSSASLRSSSSRRTNRPTQQSRQALMADARFDLHAAVCGGRFRHTVEGWPWTAARRHDESILPY
jgi:hypothetical protein